MLAQRLVRKVCTSCKTAAECAPSELDGLFGGAGVGVCYRGVGCQECRGTGYRGRVGLYEVLTMTDELRRAVAERRDSSELRRIMIEDGSPTLHADGVRLVAAGVTTPDEVLRVVAA